ncbi:MAG: tail fiber domain-containing protein, partial [Candidatus Moranbacteria bacterium]|nr:tail fiber domain-containing protein [Candidatus Moranbacteria bacterium]
PADFTFRGAAGSGSNIAGGDIYFDASNGTGAGGSGDFIFRTAPSASVETITFDNVTEADSGGNNESYLAFSHMTGTGNNRILIVGVSIDGAGSGVSSMTYAGDSLTKIAEQTSGGTVEAQLWYLVNPDSGSNTLAVTMINNSEAFSVGAMTFEGVNQSNPIGTYASAYGDSTAASVTVSSGTGQMVVDVVASDDGVSVSPGSGQTERWDNYDSYTTGGGSTENGASSVTMSWTVPNDNWAIIGVPLKQAGMTTDINQLAERMRITDTGKIGIGTSSPTELLTVYNGSTTGTYTTSGWAHSSDERLKMNVTALGGALDTVSRLQGVSFNWKTNPTGDRQIGFIAQDVLGVLPEVVTGSEEEGYGIAYGNLTALLVEAVKELHAEQGTVAASLESRLDTLDLSTGKTATTLGELQSSVNTQLAIVGDSLSTLGKETDTLDGRLAALDDPDAGRLTTLDSRILSLEKTVGLSNATLSHETRIAQIESEMTTLRDEHLALMDFFSAFELGDVMRKDALGNVDLLGGKLTLGTLVADKLCLEDVCVTKAQLQGMLDATGQAAAEPASEAVAPTASGAVAGVSTDSSGVGSTFETWAGNIDAGWTKDYLMVLDENAYASGEGNASGYSVSYDVDLSGAKKKAKLTVEFSPTADPSGIDKLTTLRIFTPEGSWLAAMSGNDGNAEFPGVFRGKKSFVIPVRISATLGRKVVVEYTLPDAATAMPYDLKIQKQAGVGAVPIAISVIGPDGTKTEKNITLDTDFVTRVQ